MARSHEFQLNSELEKRLGFQLVCLRCRAFLHNWQETSEVIVLSCPPCGLSWSIQKPVPAYQVFGENIL